MLDIMNSDKLIIQIHEQGKYIRTDIGKLDKRVGDLEKCFNKHLTNHNKNSMDTLKWIIGLLLAVPGSLLLTIKLIQAISKFGGN